MISCKHATELISQSMERKLTLKERASLNLHLFICEFCEKFRQQIELMRRALSEKDSPELSDADFAEENRPNGARERLKQVISDRLREKK